jgi:hypothetical protein
MDSIESNSILSLVKQEKKEEESVFSSVKPEMKEEDTKDGLERDIIILPLSLGCVRDFFWHALHLSVKGYSYTVQKAATGRFPFMPEAYFLLFASEKLVLSTTEIQQQIPTKYRTHPFGKGVSPSIGHWIELTLKFDPLKKMVFATVHYEIADGLDGLVKWFVLLLIFLLFPLHKADFSPMLSLLLWKVIALLLIFLCLLKGYALSLDQPPPALLWPIPKTVVSPLQTLV